MVCLLGSVLKAGGRSDVMSGERYKEGSRCLKIGVMFHSINFTFNFPIVFFSFFLPDSCLKMSLSRLLFLSVWASYVYEIVLFNQCANSTWIE